MRDYTALLLLLPLLPPTDGGGRRPHCAELWAVGWRGARPAVVSGMPFCHAHAAMPHAPAGLPFFCMHGWVQTSCPADIQANAHELALPCHT